MSFELGPKDLFDLPAHFGSEEKLPVDLSQYSIEILAEINHAPRLTDDGPLGQVDLERLQRGMHGLKQRAKNINELTDNALFYVKSRPLTLDDQAAGLLDAPARAMVAELASLLEACGEWSAEPLEEIVRTYAEKSEIKLGKVAQPLRAALTGSKTSPPIFEVMAVLGREESLGRISDVTKNST